MGSDFWHQFVVRWRLTDQCILMIFHLPLSRDLKAKTNPIQQTGQCYLIENEVE